MDKLDNNWLTQGLIDFEYKKYVLLAYFKTVRESFKSIQLYPFLSDLVFHYRNLQNLKDNKSLLRDAFPKELSTEGIRNMEMNYKKIIEDDDVMQELESIMDFALPHFKSSLDEGSFIYEYVESQCEIAPIGLTSLYKNEGYLFVAQPPENETIVYRYQMTLFDESHHTMRSIQTHHVMSVQRSLINTYENIKRGLIKQFTELPNPCAYLVTSRLKFPYQQTLMPVAKRLLIKEIAKE